MHDSVGSGIGTQRLKPPRKERSFKDLIEIQLTQSFPIFHQNLEVPKQHKTAQLDWDK